MKIAVNGKWLCANVDGYFPFLLAYISLFGSHSLKASHSPSFFCSQFMRILLLLFYRSDLCSPFTTRPVFPALGPLQALREEVLWCLAMVHLCVTTKTSGEPLSERSLCLKFGQPSWSSLFLLPSVDFSTCHFLPVVITSYYLGYSFPSQLFSRPVLSDSATPWTAACQASLSLTPPSERCSSQYL